MAKKKKTAAELLDKMIGGEAITLGRTKNFDRTSSIKDLRDILAQARALLSNVVSAGTMIATPEALQSGRTDELNKIASTLARDCRSFSEEIFRLEGRVNSLESIESDEDFIANTFGLASEIAESVERFQSTAPRLAEDIMNIVTNGAKDV